MTSFAEPSASQKYEGMSARDKLIAMRVEELEEAIASKDKRIKSLTDSIDKVQKEKRALVKELSELR